MKQLFCWRFSLSRKSYSGFTVLINSMAYRVGAHVNTYMLLLTGYSDLVIAVHRILAIALLHLLRFVVDFCTTCCAAYPQQIRMCGLRITVLS